MLEPGIAFYVPTAALLRRFSCRAFDNLNWLGPLETRRTDWVKLGNLQTQWLSDLRGAETADIFSRVYIILYVFWGLPFGYQITSISNPVSVIVSSSSGTASLCLSLSLENSSWFTWGCNGKTGSIFHYLLVEPTHFKKKLVKFGSSPQFSRWT